MMLAAFSLQVDFFQSKAHRASKTQGAQAALTACQTHTAHRKQQENGASDCKTVRRTVIGPTTHFGKPIVV